MIRRVSRIGRGMILIYPAYQPTPQLSDEMIYIDSKRSHRADHVESMEDDLSNSHGTLWSIISLQLSMIECGQTDRFSMIPAS